MFLRDRFSVSYVFNEIYLILLMSPVEVYVVNVRSQELGPLVTTETLKEIVSRKERVAITTSQKPELRMKGFLIFITLSTAFSKS